LNGALIDIRRSNTYLVGTDTRRLSIYKVKGGADEKISLIVPRKSTMEILNYLKMRPSIHSVMRPILF